MSIAEQIQDLKHIYSDLTWESHPHLAMIPISEKSTPIPDGKCRCDMMVIMQSGCKCGGT